MGTRTPVARCSPDILFLDRLPRATRRAFQLAIQFPFLARGGWYLAGGTALALQVGHRQSVDLDFFTPQRQFRIAILEQKLSITNQWVSDQRHEGTLYGRLVGAKASFIAYPFYEPSRHRLQCGTVRILLPEDIAAMKVTAISQRGRKRDFLDLYWYCTHREPLDVVIQRTLQRCPRQFDNLPHILKSLAYFADAEGDPMPPLFFRVTWGAIKKYFQREVNRVARSVIKLS